MAPLLKLAVTLLILAASTVSAIHTTAVDVPPLVARLHAFSVLNDGEQQGGNGMMECWNALMELKACTSEIVLFFLNGESYLGVDCCIAVRTITRRCWPAMLASVGFTAEEADVLRGFCDAEVGGRAPPATPVVSPPAPAPVRT